MKYFLLLTLITAQAHAGFWCPEKPNEIRFPRPNAGCFEVGSGFDPSTAAVVGGVLVVDPVKKAAKDAADLIKKQEQDAKLQKLQDCVSVLEGIDSANNVSQLKEVVKCLVERVR